MKKWLLVFLLIGTAQAACPAHPGHMLNGQVRQPTSLQPVCGPIFTAFKSGFKNDSVIKWTELYAIDNTANAGELGRKMITTIANLGFTKIQDRAPSSTEHIYGYMNASTRKVITMYMIVMNDSVYVSLTGN